MRTISQGSVVEWRRCSFGVEGDFERKSDVEALAWKVLFVIIMGVPETGATYVIGYHDEEFYPVRGVFQTSRDLDTTESTRCLRVQAGDALLKSSKPDLYPCDQYVIQRRKNEENRTVEYP